ncbi:MAG: bifunctional 23S rRNA (guanine(2069)-N(7))-methyltransferase RlmK/23S rRNA (guanine(2445)-N(2))-methyltransferase RlmL [Desulfobulbaceae bacterium]|nr:bifunctional 23S rRNA (guanine(2069)-N(7))-methyltransferase RlmK/23S rRNA (guanine(2445)-N(2))-methyltransferase RlmL [Desulfobulbaceae bacterium]
MAGSEEEDFERKKIYVIVASCAAGLEYLVQGEVERFGGQEIVAGLGVVQWRGTLESAYRCCLWSRFASRVFLELWRFLLTDEDSLYHASLVANWGEHLTEDTTFAVSCTLSGESTITHSRFAALRLKDGLVDHFREKTGKRPSVKTDRPGIQIHLHIDNNVATISLDLSGESLHRRGYRDASGRAPLKETLGAAIVALSGWLSDPQPLVDPMCGTGTLLIEAALMFRGSAPGLSRSYYGFMGWRGHDGELWRRIFQEAVVRDKERENKEWPLIVGFDCDPTAVRAARKNIELAGLEKYITIKQGEVAGLQAPAKNGLLLSNLPYGERLSEAELVAQLYRGYGRILRQRFSGWSVGVFIANPELTDSFGLSWDHKHKLYNGSIPCRLLTGRIVGGGEQEFRWQPLAQRKEGSGSEFANRLCKNLKQMLKRAEKEEVSCFRIYDRDLPEYNISIDLYGKWVHIQEWSPPKTIDPQIASARFSTAVIAVKEILGTRSDRVFLKTRERQKGRSQYEKKGNIRKMYEVREGECSFLVNFTDYLDTGLFLDHRPIRKKIFAAAKGKRFLNLYGYTGTATVHAALGGALSTTTVDLSATYLRWTRMNLALNGLGEVTNKVEQADCLEWLLGCSSTYELIFIDPPTFSNTKKEMRVFDIQEDHVRLLDLAMSRLDKHGLLIFSTNFRRFQLAESLSEKYVTTDISRQSLPFDFSRDKKVHKCWEFRHQAKAW